MNTLRTGSSRMRAPLLRLVASTSGGATSRVALPLATTAGCVPVHVVPWRSFSSSGDGTSDKKSFRPRRKPSRNYRPVKTDKVKKKAFKVDSEQEIVQVGRVPNAQDPLEAQYGPLGAELIRQVRNEAAHPEIYQNEKYDLVEDDLAAADYWSADAGTTEEMAFERRALAHLSPDERAQFHQKIRELMHETEPDALRFLDDEFSYRQKKSKMSKKAEKEQVLAKLRGATQDEDGEDRLNTMRFDDEQDLGRARNVIDPSQLAFGEWSEMLVNVNRGVKLYRGGRLESYRALVIAGNANGCGGFGIGRSPNAIKAVALASRMAKRNIFFVDRYQGDGLTRDLAGKMNSTKVFIRATTNGLRGNELCTEILKRFGIANAVCKAHGNRHPWNVVRATFKALLTHESMEDLSLKRGKRIVSLDRAMRMQI